MSLYPSSKLKLEPQGKTEFELLKSSHKFLREDDEDEGTLTWEEKLASKYYSSLYREFAVCDLKHYKSGNFALRWRTESEVLSGAGESTCGNTRCKYHELQESESSLSFQPRPPSRYSYDERGESSNSRSQKSKTKPLTTVELPFAYIEHGKPKSALVKVVLCEKCLGKLMWKRRKQKEEMQGVGEVKTEEEEEAEREPMHGEEVVVKQETEDIEVFVESMRSRSRIRGDDEGVSDSNHQRERHRGDRADRWDRERDIDVGIRRRRRSRSHSPHSRSRNKDRYHRR
ncbi:hypothetical protein VKT23_009122 [Stygiomarasmius scandens]|uniref:Protein FRA10AC1 n=1 Tax=Marasmiellus scandens TaxID=2682957 RepID=A0ABR1JGV9_9AGAR